MSAFRNRPLGIMLQVFMLQILLAEYLEMVRHEWSTNAELL
jgi:hypothetical protein